MSNASSGILLLPTTVMLCGNLATFAVNLDKRPELTRHLKSSSDEDSRKTIVESTAETIQRAFTICLTERTPPSMPQPALKKVGIYSFANLVLKLLFRCRKTTLAEQIFTNIMQNSPPLHLYPAAQRVTYLYYLGRFHLNNTHYFRAQLCLQAAYDQCHLQCIKQREKILTYLTTANLLLGRYPGPAFMSRPEASGIIQRFAPLIRAMRRGDLAAFKEALSPSSPNYTWFFRHGILLPLLFRGELLVWRSLARKTFLLTYEAPTDVLSKKAPTLDLNDLLTGAMLCQNRLNMDPVTGQQRTLKPSEGLIFGNLMPTLHDIEAIAASLVDQDLLHGFLSHNLKRFAILGSKQRGGPLNAGFPVPFQVMRNRHDLAEVEEVPGWVRREKGPAAGFGGGVVNLSGIARPVGSGM